MISRIQVLPFSTQLKYADCYGWCPIQPVQPIMKCIIMIAKKVTTTAAQHIITDKFLFSPVTMLVRYIFTVCILPIQTNLSFCLGKFSVLSCPFENEFFQFCSCSVLSLTTSTSVDCKKNKKYLACYVSFLSVLSCPVQTSVDCIIKLCRSWPIKTCISPYVWSCPAQFIIEL